MKTEIPHERINFVLLSLLLIFYPFHVKFSNVTLIVFGAHWLSWLIHKPRTFRLRDARVWLLLVPYVLIAVSLLYTTNVKNGIFILDKKIALVVLPLCLGTMPSMQARYFNRIMMVAIASGVVALLTCYGYATYRLLNDLPGGFYWRDFTEPLSFHPTYLSLYINFLIAWLGFCFFKMPPSTRLWKIVMILVVMLFFVTQVLLSSKIQLICAVLILAFFLFRLSAAANTRILIAVVVAAIVSGAIFLRSSYTWERFMHINTFEYSLNAPVGTFNEFTIRLAILECSSEIIKKNPLLGTGAGDVNDDLDTVYRKTDFKFGYLDTLNPHNEYLSQLLGLGIVGLSVFIFTLVVLWRTAWRRGDTVYIIFLLLIILSFAFESMLERQKGIFFFALFNSLFLFHHNRKNESVQDPGHG